MKARVAHHGVVRLAVAFNEALVPFVVQVAHVTTGRPGDPEDDQVLIVRWRHSEDALDRVADLVLAAHIDLGGHRVDERVRECAIAGGAGPVDGGPQVDPQLAEPGDPGWMALATTLARFYESENRLDEWTALCDQVEGQTEPPHETRTEAWAGNELAAIARRQAHLREIGDNHDDGALLRLFEAESEVNRSANARRDLRGRDQGLAQVRINRALILRDRGELDDALNELLEVQRQLVQSDVMGHALVNLALGAVHLDRGQPEPACACLSAAANTFRSLRHVRGRVAALTTLGLANWHDGNPTLADQEWNEAVRQYEGDGALAIRDSHDPDPIGRAAAYLNAGAGRVTMVRTGLSPVNRASLDEARKRLKQSLHLRQGRPEDSALGRTWLYLGDAALLLGRERAARRYWCHAVAICERVGDVTGAAEARQRP